MIYFDIETGPLTAAEMNGRMPEFTARANLKDEAKIKADIEDKRNKYFDKAALDPFTGRVCAIGLLQHEGDKPELIHYNGNPKYEHSILTKFWNRFFIRIRFNCFMSKSMVQGFTSIYSPILIFNTLSTNLCN